ncbi:hypothetical protein [Arthrobacter zhaoxinii]|uniref:hypothetical protein n=1 Tax=Arthrobacter zhaoxinii TaxID=2964616 RepID=UPI002101FCDE|nr:hypothetical protein [Arthrobacter zhaoxinii]MCQ2002103.1 hypothetical protein [Arthrobacter zhaoxinii]
MSGDRNTRPEDTVNNFERASGHPPGKSPELSRGQIWFLRTVMLGVVFLGLLVVGGPLTITAWDAGHRGSIECTVREAEGSYEPGSYRVGASWRVIIRNSDCGQLIMMEGIDESNNEAVAAELTPGGRFTFEIGAGSKNFLWLTDRLGMTTEAFSFEKID